MRLIKKSNVLQDAQKYPEDIYAAVEVWCRIVKQAHWTSIDDIRKTYKRSVDQVSPYLVFNIKSYRLIVTFNFKAQIIYYKHFLTHQEYEKGDWKKWVTFKSMDASHFEDILVGVVPPWLPSSAQNRGNHGGIAPTRSVKSLKWDAPKSIPLNIFSGF